MEPMSLWMCSCEVLPHFQQGPYCTACSCQAEVPSAAVVVLAISQVHSGVDALGRCRLWQHLLTSSPQGKCGLGTRGVTLMNGGGDTAHGDLLHNFTSASHGYPASWILGTVCAFCQNLNYASLKMIELQSNLPVILSCSVNSSFLPYCAARRRVIQ